MNDSIGNDVDTTSLAAQLEMLAVAHQILDMEGHGDLTLGHMSLRDPEGRGLWLKRAGIGMDEVEGPDDFILLDFDGSQLSGDGRRHSEWPIHAEIMKARSDVQVVAHTHPTFGSVFSAKDDELRAVTTDAAYFATPIPHFKDSASHVDRPALARDVARALGSAFAVFLRNHGVVFCGRTIPQAALVGVYLERSCRAQLIAGASPESWRWASREETAGRAAMLEADGYLEDSWQYLVRRLASRRGAKP